MAEIARTDNSAKWWRKKKPVEDNAFVKINRVKPATNVAITVFMCFYALLAILPVLLVVMVSITTSESLSTRGFSYFPTSITFTSYKSLFETGSQLVDSYLVTIAASAVTTVLAVLVMTMYAFVLAQKNFSGKKFYTMAIFITMLFSGGMVPSYIINCNVLHLYDTFWILVLPSLVSAFNIIVLRTFINGTIPDEMFDAASIDGATEFRMFFSIVLPLAKAGMATIALFVLVGKWNDYFTAMLYIDNPKLVPLQTMLTRIQQKIDFIKNNSSAAATPDGMRLLESMPTEQTRMAIVVISSLPILFAYPYFQRFFIQGLTIGSVKG